MLVINRHINIENTAPGGGISADIIVGAFVPCLATMIRLRVDSERDCVSRRVAITIGNRNRNGMV